MITECVILWSPQNAFCIFPKYDAAVDAVANNLDMVGIKAICVKSASKKLPIPSHISSSMIGA